jgi:sodium-dependent dicarboxylate transporter 2/3/5
MHEDKNTPSQRRRGIGLSLALVLALLVYLVLPDARPEAAPGAGLSLSGRAVAATGVLMATLWVTEAIPIPVTALLPIALFPLLTAGGVSVRAAAGPYAHEVIFLFLGAFLLAQSVQQWGLHRRFALRTISMVGCAPRRLVGGFMVATAFLSLWVSNTATAAMMLPIATSVIDLVRKGAERAGQTGDRAEDTSRLAVALLLAVAYGASIGGIGTIIGTPPNALLVGFLQDEFGIRVSFVRWLGVGLPLVVVFVPLAWLLLTRVTFPVRMSRIAGDEDFIRNELASLGPISRPERRVLAVFVLTAAAWILRPLLIRVSLPGGGHPLGGLTDAGIAIAAGVVLFILPARSDGRTTTLLTWNTARELPWGVLILFGGGLSLASALQATGVAAYLGHATAGLHDFPLPVVVVVVTATIVFLTELTSNTATTAAFLPILGAAAVAAGWEPLLLLVPAAIAASCAFMMPVATPPNAIIFSSGEITISQMCRPGFLLNLVAIVLIVTVTYAVAVPILGMTAG